MSAGWLVVPVSDVDVDRVELRELAATLQDVMASRLSLPGIPFVSHFVDHPAVVDFVSRHLVSAGHSFPDCEACP